MTEQKTQLVIVFCVVAVYSDYIWSPYDSWNIKTYFLVMLKE